VPAGTGSTCADTTQEKTRYLYEPAYILARSGAQAPARGLGSEATRDTLAGNPHRAPGVGTSGPDVDSTATTERLDVDPSGASQQAADLHCCYTWSGDWNWLVSVWTDARGELLDTQVLALTGVDVQRENCFYGIFDQILQQGLQLLNLAVEAGSCKPRGLSITRLGGFYVRECQGMWLCTLVYW
jgi:mediator of RNA polymerase II transcription subunit 13